MPTGGRREAISIKLADGWNRYGEADTITEVSTWGELIEAEGVRTARQHGETRATGMRVRIARLDSLPEGDFSAGTVKVTVRGTEHSCNRISDPDGRRRWQVLELA